MTSWRIEARSRCRSVHALLAHGLDVILDRRRQRPDRVRAAELADALAGGDGAQRRAAQWSLARTSLGVSSGIIPVAVAPPGSGMFTVTGAPARPAAMTPASASTPAPDGP
jgi:hypothetical protein